MLFDRRKDEFVPLSEDSSWRFCGPLVIHGEELCCVYVEQNKNPQPGELGYFTAGVAFCNLRTKHWSILTKEQAPFLAAAEQAFREGKASIIALFCSDSDVWIGTQYMGLFRYSRHDGRSQHWPMQQQARVYGSVYDMVSGENRLYLVPCRRRENSYSGSQSDFLRFFDLQKRELENVPLPRPAEVTAIACQGRWVWVGTRSGLLLLDSDEDRWVDLPVSTGTVRTVALKEGQVWVGTDSGVFGWVANRPNE